MESIAIVTGASSGIGRATALRLARDFSTVVIVARDREALEQVGQEIEAGGTEALIIDADLTEPAAAEEVVARTLMEHGRIDAVLNIAGAVPGIDLFEMTDEQWSAGTELKLHGARRLTLSAWEAMKESGGAVVFTSGTAADAPNAATAAIGTINAAIEALAKAFADRGIRDGVRVNSVSPGQVLTPRRRAMIEKWAGSQGLTVEAAEQSLLAQARISRYGEPEEIAELMAFLVSPAARWMAGTTLRMDGGEVKSI